MEPLVELVDVFDRVDLVHELVHFPVMSDDLTSSDHDLLIEIKIKLERLLSDVEGVRKNVNENQESRIRALENFRWWILGASSAISFLGGAIAHFVLGR